MARKQYADMIDGLPNPLNYPKIIGGEGLSAKFIGIKLIANRSKFSESVLLPLSNGRKIAKIIPSSENKGLLARERCKEKYSYDAMEKVLVGIFQRFEG